MSKVSDIIKEIRSYSGRNDKISVLQKNKDNELLKQFFYLSLDPMVTFGIKKIPAFKHFRTYTLQEAFADLQQLISREKTGNAAIDHLANILGSLEKDDADLVINIIDKNPDCGIAETTINKIWPKLIFEFPLMKATAHDEDSIANIRFPALSQTKLDGARCNIVVKEGKVIVLSSSGREITTHGQFDWFANITQNNQVYDGELLVVEQNGKFMDRKKGNGIVNRAIKGTIPVDQAKQLHFVCFDIIPYEDWKNGVYIFTCEARFNTLLHVARNFRHNASVVNTRLVKNEAEMFAHFNEMLEAGEEGTIVKNTASIWEGKRSREHLKLKGIITCDLEVIGIEPGTGKYEGKVGSLICRSSDGEVLVNVGSGLTDQDREYSNWVGKIVEVVYNSRILAKAEGSKWSLFLPRFSRIRLDKTVADSLDNIPVKG